MFGGSAAPTTGPGRRVPGLTEQVSSRPMDEHSAGARIWQFHGGIHLAHHKRLCTGEPIATAKLPSRLVVPLDQHVGLPAEALVAAGDRVLKGQLIGEAPGYLSVPVHAPTSGVVRAVEPRPVPHPSGLESTCVVIDSDGRDEWAELEPTADYRALDPEALRERIRAAGIVGLGGAAFPSHVKLTPPGEEPVRSLIINGAECEPYIACDEMLMRERAEQIVAGARIMQHALQARDIVIAIEDEREEIHAALRRAVRADNGDDLRLARVPTIYPEGGEKQLIQVLTGLEVPSGGLPIDLGLVCHNVATAASVHEAIEHGRPLVSRIVSVTGHGIEHPRNYEALIGTPVRDLVEQAGGYRGRVARLVIGGPLMGFALATDEAPVAKGTNCVLALLEEDVRRPQPQMPCIRCMECVRVCPAQLLPQQLYWHIEARNLHDSEDLGLFDCIECGCCAAVCPSQIPLVDYYRYAKSALRTEALERHRAERAKQRYEARERRLEREKAERAERLRRKKERLKRSREGGDERKAEIEAAVERARAKKRDGKQ